MDAGSEDRRCKGCILSQVTTICFFSGTGMPLLSVIFFFSFIRSNKGWEALEPLLY